MEFTEFRQQFLKTPQYFKIRQLGKANPHFHFGDGELEAVERDGTSYVGSIWAPSGTALGALHALIISLNPGNGPMC